MPLSMHEPNCYSTVKGSLMTKNIGEVTETIACKGISLSVDGTVTITNPDGTTQAVLLASGIIWEISTKIAITGTPTIYYWY